MKNYLSLFISIGCILIFCCKKSETPVPYNPISLATMNDTIINILTIKKFFFGHKSVGLNILEGVNQIKKNETRLKNLNLIEWQGDQLPSIPGIYHTSNGKNGNPVTKCDAFLQTLKTKHFGNTFDIAFFKFCYVDFNEATDVKAIFDYYVQTIEQVKQTFPHLKIVHVTTPLYVYAWSIKGHIKRFFIADLANVKRNEFNELLRQKYSNREPIFDLAQIESTRPDGTCQTFKHHGKSYFSLVKAYSDDGGHLNELGRKLAAQEFLRILTQAIQDQPQLQN